MGLNSTTFHGNRKYGVTKSYGLFVCRKLLKNVKSLGRQWVKSTSSLDGASQTADRASSRFHSASSL